MIFLQVKDHSYCAKILALRIEEYLKQDKKVLWLVSGGSNIAISVEAFNLLNISVPEKIRENLAVTLTDERYGPVGHKDSNWQGLLNMGFNMDNVRAVPVLCGLPEEETTRNFADNYKKLTEWADVIIGQFGVGNDGHIAGVLPGTFGVSSVETACNYLTLKFTRISLTLETIKKINSAFTFALGESKKEIIHFLKTQNIPLTKMPAQILKEIPESYLYSDQI
jgi:6-phosphogluconolactonase/glucosamine-6-phosphate isomerase/deaminase